jgi:hypothetical protein
MNIIPISFLQQPVTYAPITPSTGSMRSFLSPAGQAAYDVTSDNSWFTASAADYNAVLVGLSGTSTVGMSTAQVTTGSFSSFVGTYGTTLPQANATVPSGNYIIGFVARAASATVGRFRPYVATSYKGTYTPLGNNGVTGSATTGSVYFLRKNPASAQATASYVAVGPRNSGEGSWAGTGTWPAGGGYSTTMATGSWINFTGILPIQQFLITTAQP